MEKEIYYIRLNNPVKISENPKAHTQRDLTQNYFACIQQPRSKGVAMASVHLQRKSIIFFILAALLSTLQQLPLHAEDLSARNPVISSDLKQEDSEGEEGTASYYAKRYQNRRTSSGKRYDAAKLTAAHPSLPHGTRVKVINLANDKEVIVTINDRCRPRSEPFIDLSRSAAQQLGFLGKGKTRVRIIPLNEEGS